MLDFHIHSNYSFDCNSEPEAIIKSAIAKGLAKICFCDHLDFYYPYGDDFMFDVDDYFYTLTTLKNKYQSLIEIFIGVEIGLDLNYEKEINLVLDKYNFDFIIGSIHVIAYSDFYYGDFFNNKSITQIFQEYLNEVLLCIKTFKNISVLGHLDYLVRYIKNHKLEYELYKEQIDYILYELINTNRYLEVNTSGLRNECFQTFPDFNILKRYYDLGGRYVSVGSDAHCLNNIGANIKDTIIELQEIGLRILFSDKKN